MDPRLCRHQCLTRHLLRLLLCPFPCLLLLPLRQQRPQQLLFLHQLRQLDVSRHLPTTAIPTQLVATPRLPAMRRMLILRPACQAAFQASRQATRLRGKPLGVVTGLVPELPLLPRCLQRQLPASLRC